MFQSILSKPHLLNFIPFVSFFFFFCRSQRQSRRKVEGLCFFFAANTCTHREPTFQAKSKETAHCGRFGPWELKSTKSKMARGRQQKAWLVFLSFFIYFARLVAILGGSNSKDCRRYRFKKF